ncbi:hypothetical protein CVT25_001894 [Psilocybe cyanescens]|uniref:Uncharacterized protein n=1 Tax=Psilocybe cyanescens TaxID=93625 RepID=A0A409WQR7_PSICY|nr:hypothetical protein CVT25_001894 [Psilocybe cyanescens]
MKNSKVLALAVPLVGQHVIALVVIGRAVLQDDAFSDRCDLYRTPIEALPLGVLTVLSQTALWLAAFNKRKFSQAAVLSLVVRESHWTLGIFGLLAAVMIPYSFATHSANPFIIFVWPITFISITSCRLVLSMHELQYEGSRGESVTEFIFTTIMNSTQGSCDSTHASCKSPALDSCRSPPISINSLPTESSYELSPRLGCS